MLLRLIIMLMVCFQVSAQDKPNILLITADDLGFDDLSLHNHPDLHTPNLDKLAKQSVQFSDFSVTPVCSTTRAALLTGRDFYKTGVSGVHGGRDFMHRSETLISDILQDNGYATGLWGKWHIGKTEGYMPTDRGFDQAYYAELYQHKNSHGFFNGKPIQHKSWVSEVITDYAINFIEDNKNKPFFAYASYLAPHEPWLAPDKFTQKFLSKGMRPAIANLYGMIEEMDFHIGRLLASLESSGMADNTIVIFMSDNGPWWDSSNLGAMTKKEWQERNPSQLNGNKGQSWQNGIKSPLFISWPNKWKPTTVDRYVDVKDIFPTLLEVTNIKHEDKPIDGISFLPYLQGDSSGINPRETYIGSHDVISHKKYFNQWTPLDQRAREQMTYQSQLIGIRTENHKLILNPANDREGYPNAEQGYVLIDMKTDPKEQNNIYSKQPVLAKELAKKLEDKFYSLLAATDSVSPPVFIVGGANKVSIVNGFGASSTKGNTTSKAHHMTNMKVAGDEATYLIDVLKAGTYDVYFKQENTDSSGIVISLKSHKNIITHELSESPHQKLGELTFAEGQQAIQFTVKENNSYKPWAKISAFRRLLLVPKNYPLNTNDYIGPR